MPLKCMRLVIAVMGAIGACASPALAQQSAPDVAAYRDAVGIFIQTGDAAAAIKPMAGRDRKTLDAVIADTRLRADRPFLEAAALMHLEIAAAIAGLSLETANRHLELGEQLIDGLIPLKAEERMQLTEHEIAALTQTRSRWLGVAGSVFLSVSATDSARGYFSRALKLTPKSAPILTMAGVADEIDGTRSSAEDSDSERVRTRAKRERVTRWLSADRFYHRALDADPAYPLAQIRQGRLAFLNDQRKAARRWLEQGVSSARDPLHQYLAAMFMGDLQQQEKDFTGARSSYERALAISPRSQSAYVALAYLEVLAGRPDRAQTLVRSYTGSADADEAWWVFKNGTFDFEGLKQLRQRVRR